MSFEIVPCRTSHLREVANNLREEERLECEAFGVKPRHMMHALYRDSSYSRAGLLDGEVLAVWGDNAPILHTDGYLWLFSTPMIERVPFLFFREARREIEERLMMRRVLRSSICWKAKRSRRFWELLGFEIVAPDEGGLSEIRRERLMVETAITKPYYEEAETWPFLP
jgi:hypothetical protein